MEQYDVAIIGAGVTGAATAAVLSRYQLRVALLEKAADVSFGVSKANSGIVHGGFHYPLTTLKGRLEILGNLMFEKLQYELGFPFRRCGIIVAAFSAEQMETVRKLYRQGVENRVPRIELCSRERVLELEPKLAETVQGGLYAPNGGVIEPYRYVFALTELAQANGVELFTNFKVESAEWKDGARELHAADGRSIRAAWTVNAAGLFADEVSALLGGESFRIKPRKGEEYLLDRRSAAYPDKVIFPVPTAHSKGVLVIPTVDGTTMVGPTADITEDKEDNATTAENMHRIFKMAKSMVPAVSERDLITSFSGSRPVLDTEDFFIAPSATAPGLIQAAGIQSPGLTASPAVAEYIRDLLRAQGVEMKEKTKIATSIPLAKAIRHQSREEADKLHAENPAWTRIICRCESISEAEIVNAIRHGHTTLDGIKLYTRAGMGRCQGGFCSYKIMKIIARETGMPLEEITKRGGLGRLLRGHLGRENTEVKA
ncbi:MAG: NAD(P)/FAD-dependent oxidoreductase [Lentisphaeria bacterium]|nr:NAD(P)/FAD-dependent oxidoreductase [Lentisphaeria bacterium]